MIRKMKREWKRKLAAMASSAMMLMSGTALAADLPTGFSSQDATVTRDGSKMVINQNETVANIDWKTFDIAQGYSVFFNQNVNDIAINNVIGGTRSDINGSLTGAGTIVLVNPNGISFGSNANVNVGSLVASTMGVMEENINQSQFTFSVDSSANKNYTKDSTPEHINSNYNGIIYNYGNITAKNGIVALISRASVFNFGNINAVANGKLLGKDVQAGVYLAAGEKIILTNDNQTGKINFAVSVKDNGLDHVICSSGQLGANDGYVLMTAGAANSLKASLVNNTGIIQAKELVKNSDGSYSLVGSSAGIKTVELAAGGAGNDTQNSTGVFTSALGAASGSEKIGNIVIKSDSAVTAKGEIIAANEVEVEGKKDVNLKASSAKTIDITSKNGSVVTGDITSQNSANISAGNAITVNNKITAGNDINLAANYVNVTKKADMHAQNLHITSNYSDIDVTDGTAKSKASAISATALGETLKDTNVTLTTTTTGIDNADIRIDSALTKGASDKATTLTLQAQRNNIVAADVKSNGGALNLALQAGSNGENIVDADISTKGGNLTSNGATYFGLTREEAEQAWKEGKTYDRNITTAGGDVTLGGDVILATGGTVTLDAGTGNLAVSGRINSGNSYYYQNLSEKSWDAAYKGAHQYNTNSHLATITSAYEEAAVLAAVNEAGVASGNMAYTAGVATNWTKNSDGKYERTWAWADGPEQGVVFTEQTRDQLYKTDKGTVTGYGYTNWREGEPNGEESVGHDAQRYMTVNYDHYSNSQKPSQWDDTHQSDSKLNGYIVETELGTTSLAVQANNITVTGKIGGTDTIEVPSVDGTKATVSLDKTVNQVSLNGSGKIDVAAIDADGDITLKAGTALVASGDLTSKGNITTSSGTDTDLKGNIQAAGDFAATARNHFWMNQSDKSKKLSAQNISITTDKGSERLDVLEAKQDINLNSNERILLDSGVTAGQDITADGLKVSAYSDVTAGRNVSLSANNKTVSADGKRTYDGIATYGNLKAGGDITLSSDTHVTVHNINANNGNLTISAATDVKLGYERDNATAEQVADANSIIKANNINVTAGNNIYKYGFLQAGHNHTGVEANDDVLALTAENGNIELHRTTSFDSFTGGKYELPSTEASSGTVQIKAINGSVTADEKILANKLLSIEAKTVDVKQLETFGTKNDGTSEGHIEVTAANGIKLAEAVSNDSGQTWGSGHIVINNTGEGNVELGTVKSILGKVKVTAAAGNVTVNSLTAKDKVLIEAGKDIQLNGAVSSGYAGDSAVVLTSQTFTNNAGSQAVKVVDGASWQIYSAAPEGNKFGNLNSGNYAVWNTPYNSATAYDKNLYFFSGVAPSFTITANDAAKDYGAVSAGAGYVYQSSLAGKYTGAEYTNAFLDGAVSAEQLYQNVTSGEAELTSAGFAADAAVGSYAINVSGVSGKNGYSVNFLPGTLTVSAVGDESNAESTREIKPTSNVPGTGSIGQQSAQNLNSGVDRVLGLADGKLPMFKVANKHMTNYGTYEIASTPDAVKLTAATTKKTPALPVVAAGNENYRQIDRTLATEQGTAKFSLTYNGTTLNIYPTDKTAKELVRSGEETQNVELLSKALFTSQGSLGVDIADLDGVVLYADATEAEASK